MLGSRKYRRWLNNQLLINKGRAFQLNEYFDILEYDEIESIIVSSSFRDPNYKTSPSIWIKLSLDDELYRLYLDCDENTKELSGTRAREKGVKDTFKTQSVQLLSGLRKRCSFLGKSGDTHDLLQNEYLEDSSLKSCVAGYLGKVFGGILSLLDHEDLIGFVFDIENLIVDFIREDRVGTSTWKLVLVSNSDCRMMSIHNRECNDPRVSRELGPQFDSRKGLSLLVIQGCNKLLRKIVHSLCAPYSLRSKSINLLCNAPEGGSHARSMVLSQPKSEFPGPGTPEVKISTLLRLNRMFSRKETEKQQLKRKSLGP
ncbi:R3H domain containing protein [Cryptosporidium felis]|nr:R3H domain containing protein [Cryptosporidium felis]